MLVLILWGPISKILFPPTESPPGEQTPGVETGDTLAADTGLARTETARSKPIEIAPPQGPGKTTETITAASAEPEQLITIETENVIAVLSSHGGLLKSLKLKKYFVENGSDGDSLVQLIATGELNPWPAGGALTMGEEDDIPQLNSASFQVEGSSFVLNRDDEPRTVSFVYSGPDGSSIRKDYTFWPRGHEIKLRLTVEKPAALGFDKKLTVGWFSPLMPTERNYKDDLGKFAGFYSMGGEAVENKDLKEGELRLLASGSSQWVANRSKYFANVIITEELPGSEIIIAGNQSSLTDHAGGQHAWKRFGVGLTFNVQGDRFTNDLLIYSGPLDYYRLSKIGYNLSQLIDMGWKIFRPFAIGILWIFVQLHKVLFNYGIVIIVFSLLMKFVFWPLTRKSSTSMLKMKEMQPKLQELKAKFKNEPQKLNAETMRLYKEYGVNPFSSCLPLLIQLPVFWAMFSVLQNSIELRAAGFVFWITDLSQKDQFYVLPIIMGAAMFIQQKMTITDPKQKMLAYIMPVVFVFLFASWPSGLVLYWTMFSVIGIFEQLIILRRLEAEKKAVAS